jgi:hypothetical protein
MGDVGQRAGTEARPTADLYQTEILLTVRAFLDMKVIC